MADHKQHQCRQNHQWNPDHVILSCVACRQTPCAPSDYIAEGKNCKENGR
jgi:hypothetical protein